MVDIKHGGKAKQCQVIIVGFNGKKQKCGNPLDKNGQCPTHGRPW